MTKKKALLLDEGEEDLGGLTIKVNEDYARRFEVRASRLAGRRSCRCRWRPLPPPRRRLPPPPAAATGRARKHRPLPPTGRATQRACVPRHLLQHNKRREELHRLQEKHPHLAAKLAAKYAQEVRTPLHLQGPGSRGCTAAARGPLAARRWPVSRGLRARG